MPNYPYPPPAGWDGYEDASGSGSGNGWYVSPEGYPPGPSSSYQGPSQTTRRDTVGSSSRLSFSTQADAESKTPGSGTGGGTKKKRKKGSPGETEKEKEKRTKTGRACDACVRFFCAPLIIVLFVEGGKMRMG
jgi:hypothetical protein